MPPFRSVNDTKGVALTGSPHSQAIVSDDGNVYCSGQLPMDATGKLIEGSIKDKTRQCIQNLQAVLENAGSALSHIMKVNIFLADMKDFPSVNTEYSKWFQGPTKPARSCVAVKQLPRGGQVEIECIAKVRETAKL